TGLLTLLPIWLVWIVFKFVLVLLSDLSRPWVRPLSERMAYSFPGTLGWVDDPWAPTQFAALGTVIFIVAVGALARRVAGEPALGAAAVRAHGLQLPRHPGLGGRSLGANAVRGAGHGHLHRRRRRPGPARGGAAGPGLVRGRDRPHSAGQDHLWQRPQAARPAADQARQHPAGGADRLPAPRDEVRRPGDPGHARTGQRPRTGRGVRAHHPQPDL